jgi:hypothetical protein
MEFGAVNVERIECLRAWIRTGLVTGWRKELMMKFNIQKAQKDSQEVDYEGECKDDD